MIASTRGVASLNLRTIAFTGEVAFLNLGTIAVAGAEARLQALRLTGKAVVAVMLLVKGTAAAKGFALGAPVRAARMPGVLQTLREFWREEWESSRRGVCQSRAHRRDARSLRFPECRSPARRVA